MGLETETPEAENQASVYTTYPVFQYTAVNILGNHRLAKSKGLNLVSRAVRFDTKRPNCIGK